MTNRFFNSKRKKLCAVLSLLTLMAYALLAYDGTIMGGYDGNCTRYSFIQQASNSELARNILQNAGVRIDKLFPIGENDVDEEDVEMLNDLVAYIPTQFDVKDGDSFSYIVMRGATDKGVDGWIVFSHYLMSKGWFHYLYYFEAAYDEAAFMLRPELAERISAAR